MSDTLHTYVRWIRQDLTYRAPETWHEYVPAYLQKVLDWWPDIAQTTAAIVPAAVEVHADAAQQAPSGTDGRTPQPGTLAAAVRALAEQLTAEAAHIRAGLPSSDDVQMDSAQLQDDATASTLAEISARLRATLLGPCFCGCLAPVPDCSADPRTPSPEQLWLAVRTSEQGQAARQARRELGRVSTALGYERDRTARLRTTIRALRRDVQTWRDAALDWADKVRGRDVLAERVLALATEWDAAPALGPAARRLRDLVGAVDAVYTGPRTSAPPCDDAERDAALVARAEQLGDELTAADREVPT